MSEQIQKIQQQITPILKQTGVFSLSKDIKIDTISLVSLAKKYNLKFIILHGSFATGKNHQNSDLDIAVLGEHELSYKQMLELYGEADEFFKLPAGVDLDFKTLNKVDPLFRYEVTRDGKLLFGNKADYEDFKASSFRAYEDARPLFELEKHLVQKFQLHLNSLYVK